MLRLNSQPSTSILTALVKILNKFKQLITPKDKFKLVKFNNLKLVSGKRFYEKKFQIAIVKILKKSNFFIDVGSCRGMYVLLAQHHMAANSKIYGFEPNLVYQKELSKLNIEKNIYYKNYNVALSDKIGKKSLYKNSFLRRMNRKGKTVKTISLDKFLSKNIKKIPNIVKIDVEGWEFKVLKGCKKLIKNKKTHFFVEIHDKYLKSINKSTKDVLKLFNKKFYYHKKIDFKKAINTNLIYYHFKPKKI